MNSLPMFRKERKGVAQVRDPAKLPNQFQKGRDQNSGIRGINSALP